jgi:protein-disulfide isomerase
MVKCDICGDEFDTERGMKIHRTEMHSSDESSNESSESGSETDAGNPGNENRINLSPKLSHLMLAVLCVGFLAGGFSGYVASDALSTVQTPGEQALTGDDDNNPSPSGDTETGNTEDNADTGSQTGLSPSEVTLEGEPVLGEEDAPVTMLAYEDFQCPFCKQFEEGAVPQIVENYVDSGQVKIVWKDRPLPNLHPWAEDATMECVYREGGNDPFWTVKDKIFANQDSISTSNVQSEIKQWASQEGVSEAAVQSCLDNGNPMEEVNTDSKNGQKLGASGTPTAYVNGEELVGAQPYSRFETVIEDALN